MYHQYPLEIACIRDLTDISEGNLRRGAITEADNRLLGDNALGDTFARRGEGDRTLNLLGILRLGEGERVLPLMDRNGFLL